MYKTPASGDAEANGPSRLIVAEGSQGLLGDRSAAVWVWRSFQKMVFVGYSRLFSPRWRGAISASLALAALLSVMWFGDPPAAQDLQSPSDAARAQAAPDHAPTPPYAQQSPEQLQQLVAPIALYPDSLVAQILAAATFPEQVVEADRWLLANGNLKGGTLAQLVDQQPWDPSVKALTAFASVLGNMDKNLQWTSSLGDAYYNQQGAVMDAIQVMRQRAQQAGNLKSTSQQVVTDQDSTIAIQPVDPEVVYVPAYDPWLIYGDPIVAWPGWYDYPGIWFDGPYLSFGVGFGIGFLGAYEWGWHGWGFDWRHRGVLYNHGAYISRSTTFYNRGNFYRGGAPRGGFGGAHGGTFNHPEAAPRPFGGDAGAARGYAEPHEQIGMRSGAFSDFDHGGEARGFSARGSSSFEGGARGGGEARGGGRR
jgi:hypothetical protein